MGEIHKLTCRECGAEEAYSTGVGMLYAETSIKLLQGDLNTLKYEVSEAVFKQVSKLIADETGKLGFIQDQDNFFCEICNTASHLKQLEVIGLTDGEWIETLKCVKCDADLKKTGRQLDEFNCKICGKAALSDERVGLWD